MQKARHLGLVDTEKPARLDLAQAPRPADFADPAGELRLRQRLPRRRDAQVGKHIAAAMAEAVALLLEKAGRRVQVAHLSLESRPSDFRKNEVHRSQLACPPVTQTLAAFA